jgi:DNA-binding CsgD family transcriptional regulator
MNNHHIPLTKKKLSPRELQITSLVAQDKSDKEIACILGIKIGTVKAISGNARLKLDVRGRVGLAVWYAENHAG